MKRSELKVGMEVAVKRGEHYPLERAFVVAVEPYVKVRNYVSRNPLRQVTSGNGVAVAVVARWMRSDDEGARWHPDVVQLSQLKGDYGSVKAADDAHRQRAAEYGEQQAAARQELSARVRGAIAAMRELDVDVPTYLERDGQVTLPLATVEQLVQIARVARSRGITVSS